MASFKKLKNGNIRAFVCVNSLRDTKTFLSRKKAKSWASDRESELRRLGAVQDDSRTFGDMFKRYSEEVSPEKAGAHWEILRLNMFLRESTSLCKVRLINLKSAPLATAEQQAKNLNAGEIKTNQNVFFSNPNTSSVKNLEKLCKDAGLNFVGVNTSNRDLRRFNTFKNAGMEVGKIMSLAVAGGAAMDPSLALKFVGASGADKVFTNGVEAALSGNYVQLGAALVAASVITLGVSKKMQKIRAGAHCTFGKGNQKWYADDKGLFV